MRQAIAPFLLTFFFLASVGEAKVIEAPDQIFSVEIPDKWTFNKNEGSWQNADNSGAVMIIAPKIDWSLEEWARNAAKQNPKTIITNEYLGGVTAKRLEFSTSAGFKVRLWISKKGNKNAAMTLVSSKSCPDNIGQIQKRLLASFRWR